MKKKRKSSSGSSDSLNMKHLHCRSRLKFLGTGFSLTNSLDTSLTKGSWNISYKSMKHCLFTLQTFTYANTWSTSFPFVTNLLYILWRFFVTYVHKLSDKNITANISGSYGQYFSNLNINSPLSTSLTSGKLWSEPQAPSETRNFRRERHYNFLIIK